MGIRAAIIGNTGRGNYGHGLDVVFTDFPGVTVVAVADPDAQGRATAQTRAGATRAGATNAYADYREMLEKERPDLVAIAPRWVGERVPMVAAAAAVGAHLFIEKPIAATLTDADAMLAAADRAGVKMAVAHQGRLHPAALHARKLIQDGMIGRLRLVRGYGKMDHRGGGQDLHILGTHVLDAMRLFAGDARWAGAEIFAGARLADFADVRQGDEEIGPIAGDGLRATFGFAGDVLGLFESFAGLGEKEDLFGIELVGDRGQLSLRGGLTKRLLFYPRPYVIPGAADDRWTVVPVPGADAGEVPGGDMPSEATLFQRGNQRLIRDLLAAIEEDREPAASGRAARSALEMIQAIAAAHVAGGRIALPLVERDHPWGQ